MPEPPMPPPPVCPDCGSARTARTKRKGLLQRLVLHYFGLYPWTCGGCQHAFVAKNRGKLKRRRRTTGEVHLPPIT